MKICVTHQPDGTWAAVDLDNYEAESDGVGWWSKSPVGYGSTESEAIADLMNQINGAAPEREPVAQALNAVIGALDVVASMALDPQDYDEVAAEKISIGQVITRAQLILSLVEARDAKPLRRVQ